MPRILLILLLSTFIINQPVFSAKKPAKPAEAAAAAACEKTFAQMAIPDEYKDDVAELIATLTAYVKKHKSPPTLRVLAREAKMNIADVEAIIRTVFNTKEASISHLVEYAKEEQAEVFDRIRKRFLQRVAAYIRDNLKIPTVNEIKPLVDVPQKSWSVLIGSYEEIIDAALAENPKHLQRLRNRLVQAYANYARGPQKLCPTKAQLAKKLKITEKELDSLLKENRAFESWEALKAEVKRTKYAALRLATDPDVFNADRNQKILEAVRTHKRIFLSGIIAGANVDSHLIATIKKYAAENDAAIILIALNGQTTGIPEEILNDPEIHILIKTDLELSSELRIDSIPIMVKQINPLTGLNTRGKPGQTMIVGSPQMHVRTIASTSPELGPVFRVSTGTVSEAEYISPDSLLVQERTAKLASWAHQKGGMIIERANPQGSALKGTQAGIFHWRHVEYTEGEGFFDLGKFYTPEGTSQVEVPSIVLGDLHITHADQKLLERIPELVQQFNPRVVAIHDAFDGTSINHHEAKDLMSLIQRARKGQLSVEDEIKLITSFYNSLLAKDSDLQILSVASNHTDFLHRWLKDSSRWLNDPVNALFAAQLLQASLETGMDPYEYAILHMAGLLHPDRVLFPQLGEDFVVNGVNIGHHGHKGPNGRRGSVRTDLEVAQGELTDRGKIVSGHSHQYERINHVIRVGTLTLHRVGYNNGGASSWVQAVAITGPNGEVQVLVFRGQWFTEPDKAVLKDAEFFEPGYPRIEKPKIAPGKIIDQHSHVRINKDAE